jgi:hypothetical protein
MLMHVERGWGLINGVIVRISSYLLIYMQNQSHTHTHPSDVNKIKLRVIGRGRKTFSRKQRNFPAHKNILHKFIMRTEMKVLGRM